MNVKHGGVGPEEWEQQTMLNDDRWRAERHTSYRQLLFLRSR